VRKYIFKFKSLLILSLITIALAACVEVFKAYVIQKIIDSTSSINSKLFLQLTFYVIFFLIFALTIMILQSYICNKFIKKCIIYIKDDMFKGVMNKNILDYNKYSSSDYVSSLTNDINTIEKDYFQNLLLVLEYIITFIFSLIAIFSIHYYFLIFIAITAWLPLIVNKIMSNIVTKRKMEYSDESSYFLNKITDILNGFETIKLYNANEVMEKIFYKSNFKQEEKRFNTKITDSICEFLSFICSLLIWLGSLLLGCYLVLEGKLTIGYVLGASQLLNSIVNPLYRLSFLTNKMKASNKLFEKRLLQSQASELEVYSDQKTTFQNSIIFSNVTIKIGEKQILKNINIKFEIGKKYLIIGESGSGKSTLFKVLMRYYDDYEGSIKVDNIELNKINARLWYQIISLVQQKVYSFNDTIENNITLYQNFKNLEIDKAINESQISEFLNSLPEKIDTQVIDNGKNISGGEAQRISLARAFIKKSQILLLDEATSALDAITAYEVEKTVLDLKNVTVLAISHKINNDLVQKYDKIMVIKNGCMVECGTYNEIKDKINLI